MIDRYRGNSDAFIMDVPRWPPAPVNDQEEPEPEPEQLSPRDLYKRKLARQWIDPRAPKYWEMPPANSVAQVAVPSAANPPKGSGPPLSEEEIALYRALFRAEYISSLRARWQNDLYHL
jgi:hypothetical protein